MYFFPFLLLVLLYFSWGLKQLESTALRFDKNDANHSILKAPVITLKQECDNKCGDLTIPYPFGINSKGLDCSINPSFSITCNNTTNPPKAFLMDGNVQVYDISNNELRISNFLAYRCYSQSGSLTNDHSTYLDLGDTTYMYSAANVFTVVGCDDYANIYNAPEGTLPKGCSTTCQNIYEVTENETCSGSGCCQVPINVMHYFRVYLHTYNNHTNVVDFNRCGYAFMGEKGKFTFRGESDLIDPTFWNRTLETVPIVLDWVIGNENCTEAAKNSNSPICYANSKCIHGTQYRGYKGYRCNCTEGYEGNPYLSPGCQDIDECEQRTHGCEQYCNNTPGSFNCFCGPGHYIDVRDGKTCIAKRSKSQLIYFALGTGLCCLTVVIGMNWLYCIMKQRKHSQLRDKFFEQNGGFLLRQQSISDGGTVESTKHFTYEELKKATNNFATDRIVGQGGYGIVYKGILPDQRIVAVKRSKVLDTSQIDQFINEVVILARVNHRNVVKLLGCCLECEVPLLVYEFISNGTLHHHVHSIDGGLSWLSLDNRLRVAAESCGALAYLHSAASMPIMHRDVKLANILLDDNCVAKISDFGASRLVPMDQTKVVTLVQGTLGYLDPEYFHTGELTEKSDVYSFGVVLAELLTGRKPICVENSLEEKNLATYFITSLKENRLFQVLDRRVVREGAMDQLEKAAQLVKRCLNLNGEERPTMKEVMMEIESLRKLSKHPWANQHANEETLSLKGQPEIQHSDLYEIQLSSHHSVLNDSQQYSLGIGFGCLSIIIGVNWLYCIIRKRKHSQLREKLFMQNGGLLLRQQTISEGGQLTDKSDVYSFGVVLAELLTGRKPICMANSPEERNLATYFVTSLKENRLYQILEPRILKEGSLDQLQKAAELVKRCLKLSGDKRPTMKEVAIEIENLRKFTKHPWANRHDNEETTSFIGQTELPYSDLYEIQQSSCHNVVNDSLQYSSSTISLLHPPSGPH
ncbi:putative wall-associated receptor kinase-like protein 16 [Heracleum sosnowskyi]|uniref:Wall-associated receptor kinase-like protein 16 n=1 Tax=Heracleum sosnowskyi TaxID=360622 RepID=A0AAD8M0X2_9APIA|nr:putative wall-associated receptor kinase-like protein 16 [Heracleum sosnowskyi]